MPLALSKNKSISSKKVKPKPIPRPIPNDVGQKTQLPTSISPLHRESFSKSLDILAAPRELQQLLLNSFKNAFVTRIDDQLQSVIQQVKQHLFNREFDQAFSEEAFLDAYATRWSPSRALTYFDILIDLSHLSSSSLARKDEYSPKIGSFIKPKDDLTSLGTKTLTIEGASPSHEEATKALSSPKSDDYRIVCIGGGAGAEIVALAGYFHLATSWAQNAPLSNPRDQPTALFNITAIDKADWSNTTEKIYAALTTNPPLSSYVSASAKDSNAPLVNASEFQVHFHQQDILTVPPETMKDLLRNVKLVTLMFTLNELYSTSMTTTTTTLLSITAAIPHDALLLVVDSPGSYSTVTVGSATASADGSKTYPMQWLLDHTLLEAASIGDDDAPVREKQWEKLYSNDSRWFRLPSGLTYPIGLEDVRCQVHLYRRLKRVSDMS